MTEKAAALKAEGNASFLAGDFEAALKSFSQAIDATPQDHVLYSNRSGAYASLRRYQEALEDADMSIKLKADWAKGYSRRGAAYMGLNRFPEARKSYEKGLQLDPDSQSIQIALQDAVDQIERPSMSGPFLVAMLATQKCPRLQKYRQEDPEYVTRLAEILQKVEKDPENIKLIMAQSDERLRDGVAYVFNGSLGEVAPPLGCPIASGASGGLGSAAGCCGKAGAATAKNLTPEEQHAEELKQKGTAFYKQRKFKEALEAYEESFKANPKEILYLNNMAAVHLELGDYSACMAMCEKALDLRYEVKADFYKVAKVYSRMAVCYSRQKCFDKAIEMYEKSLCENNSRETRAALTEVKKIKDKTDKEAYVDPAKAEEHREEGNKFFKANKYPEAKREYDEAIKRNPKDAKLYSNRAAAWTKLFEYPSALKDCEVALALDPSFVKAHSRKGTLHMLMKEYPKALEAFEKGLQLEPNNKECNEGKMNVIVQIQSQQGSKDVDEEQLRHSMADPEIQAILKDPQMNIVLSNLQEKPQLLQEYMKDSKIQNGIQKLIAAGILRVG